jgi:hypothetical protein
MNKKRLVTGLSATLILLAVSVSAQTRPDFSGRWVIEPEPAAPANPAQPGSGARVVSGDMGSGWGSTITVTQDASRLTVEYAFFARGDLQPPLRFIYALDGSETKNSVMMGRGVQVQTSKTAWDGNKLVIVTMHSFQAETGEPVKIEVKQTLSLVSPTSMLVETARSGVLGGPPSMTKTVYKKS